MPVTDRPEPTKRLAAAEAIDSYIRTCRSSWLNSIARSKCQYTPSFLEHPEAERLLREVDEIPLLKGATIVILHPTAENGYPHTRPGDLVCLPTTAVEGKATIDLATTLRHEAIHIHQRRNPAVWSTAVIREGWTPIGQGQIPADLRGRCRLNPDTLIPKQFWAWEARHVPLPLFFRYDRPTLADVQVKWFDLNTQALYNDPPATFTRRYGSKPTQPEHPFELLAVEFADAGLISDEDVMRNLKGK